MRVRIICYEDVNRWILGKFALKMEENLAKLGVDIDIAKEPDASADINHHIIYDGYGSRISPTDTIMITHIDSTEKIVLLKRNMQSAKMGICMSKETMINLSNLGIPREKLCYVNPAHDGLIIPRTFVVGITCRVQIDGRKREYMLGELAKKLNPDEFSFIIMGEHWLPYVNQLIQNGFKVTYYEQFDYNTYTGIFSKLDYYLYMGQDEGQMGFIDALAAGVKTIVTPQGYHLDANKGISYPFTTMDELLKIFDCIAEEKRVLVRAISSWNWLDYSKKHLDVWNYLLSIKDNKKFVFTNKEYLDGIMSVEAYSQEHGKISFAKKLRIYRNLFKERIRHSYYSRKNKNRED